jgi:hypothetical protein
MDVMLLQLCHVHDGSVVRHKVGILEIAGSNPNKFSFPFCILKLKLKHNWLTLF